MPEILIALGSNVGDPMRFLREAVGRLREEFEVREVAKLYRTAPMYVTDQPDFINGALAMWSDRGPLEVLGRLKAIEMEIGRHVGKRYGPREIDLDLIAYGGLRYRFTDAGRTLLQVPHPRIPERRFVLAPLNDIRPAFVLPGLGMVHDLLVQTNDQAESVREIEDAVL